jgi:signal peptidase
MLAVLSMATLLGRFSWLIERSDSMAPYLHAGDLLAVQRVSPRSVHIGDVVTFKEPSRPGILLTHRVTSKSKTAFGYQFVTKGDANTGTEQWTVKTEGTIGRLVVRIPKAGRVVSYLGKPKVRFVCLTLASLLLAADVLRRIWGGAGPKPEGGRRVAGTREAGRREEEDDEAPPEPATGEADGEAPGEAPEPGGEGDESPADGPAEALPHFEVHSPDRFSRD